MTAADFSNLHLQYKAEQAEGEVPAVIEHDFPGGRMVDHYFVTPSPDFWADEGVQSLDGVSGILFLQQPDGAPWKILVHEPSMIKEVVFDRGGYLYTGRVQALADGAREAGLEF